MAALLCWENVPAGKSPWAGHEKVRTRHRIDPGGAVLIAGKHEPRSSIAKENRQTRSHKEKIMSTILRSAFVLVALLGTVSTASATSYSNGYSNGHGRWVKTDGKWKHNTADFFRNLKRNGS
jgi:hypothetical protein